MTVTLSLPPPGDRARSTAESTPPKAAGGVVFERVSKSFQLPGGEVRALRDVSLGVEPGRIFGVIGRSGAGKSTLLRLVNRLERPSLGRVIVSDLDVGTLQPAALTRLRRRIGMIFQHFNLLSAKTVGANVGLPLRIAGVPPRAVRAKVEELLQLVGLADKRDVYPAKLSGGQKQRVGIARALVHDPEILLCDEATSALDPETTMSLLALLREINARLGLTIILITHEMSVIREVCDRVAVIDHGRLVEEGPVWRVFGAPGDAATQALLRPGRGLWPREVTGPLSSRPRAAGDALVLGVRIDGRQGVDPDLGSITSALDRPARLLFAEIDRIQGHALGELAIALTLQPDEAPHALVAALDRLGHHAEVLGYADQHR